MKKCYAVAAAMLIVFATARAQSSYTLSTLTGQAYTPLSGATTVNGSTPWFTKMYTMPIGFTAKLGSKTVTQVFADGGDVYADTTGTAVDIFQIFYADSGQCDRGLGGSMSLSPMMYATTGSAPNRIFKHEVRGSGFPREKQKYGAFSDSVAWQIWIYEGSNVVELHYGPSKLAHAMDYFGAAGPAFAGYFNVNFSTGMGNRGVFAAGTVTTPYADSFTTSHNPANLSAYPAMGTVYRFTPMGTTGIATGVASVSATVYPSETNGPLCIHYMESGAAEYGIISVTGALAGMGGLISSGVNAIDVSALSAGMYILRIKAASGGSGVYRFVRR